MIYIIVAILLFILLIMAACIKVAGDCSRAEEMRDRKQFVYCEYCKYHAEDETCPREMIWCEHICRYMKKDDFCSLGKREVTE